MSYDLPTVRRDCLNPRIYIVGSFEEPNYKSKETLTVIGGKLPSNGYVIRQMTWDDMLHVILAHLHRQTKRGRRCQDGVKMFAVEIGNDIWNIKALNVVAPDK